MIDCIIMATSYIDRISIKLYILPFFLSKSIENINMYRNFKKYKYIATLLGTSIYYNSITRKFY